MMKVVVVMCLVAAATLQVDAVRHSTGSSSASTLHPSWSSSALDSSSSSSSGSSSSFDYDLSNDKKTHKTASLTTPSKSKSDTLLKDPKPKRDLGLSVGSLGENKPYGSTTKSLLTESLRLEDTSVLNHTKTAPSASVPSSSLGNGFSSISSSILDRLKAESPVSFNFAAPSSSVVNGVSSSNSNNVNTESTNLSSSVTGHEASSSVVDNVKTETVGTSLGSSSGVVTSPVVEKAESADVSSEGSSDATIRGVLSSGEDHKRTSSELSAEPVIEAADPSAGVLPDTLTNNPVKKVPFYVPVEHAAAYHPANFYNPYPVRSSLGMGMGMFGAPPSSTGYPYRSTGHPLYNFNPNPLSSRLAGAQASSLGYLYRSTVDPWYRFNPNPLSLWDMSMLGAPPSPLASMAPLYRLVSTDVPILTLHPRPVDNSYRVTGGLDSCNHQAWSRLFSTPSWSSGVPPVSYAPHHGPSRPHFSAGASLPPPEADNFRTSLVSDVSPALEAPVKILSQYGNREFSVEPEKSFR